MVKQSLNINLPTNNKPTNLSYIILIHSHTALLHTIYIYLINVPPKYTLNRFLFQLLLIFLLTVDYFLKNYVPTINVLSLYFLFFEGAVALIFRYVCRLIF